MKIRQHISLKPFNTFGVEAQARYFAELTHVQQIVEPGTSVILRDTPLLLLGEGSNILFTRDFPGVVLRVAIPGIQIVKENKAFAWVKAGAGVNWHHLVMHCIDAGLGGLENLSLIPGTVGAAPIQNIGAYGVEIKDRIASVQAVDLASGETQHFTPDQCDFGYRNSIFKNVLKDRLLITHVTFRLLKQPVPTISYAPLQAALEAAGKKAPTPRDISGAVIRIRQSKLPDPVNLANAGSFFKNPMLSRTTFGSLKTRYPAIPSFPAVDGRIKIPAAWLIEQCGWKGRMRGAAGVHREHALVLINHGGATGQQIADLARDIAKDVHARFKVTLEPEVNIL